MIIEKLWYAYQINADDTDWGYGTYAPDEAIAWLKNNPEGRIAVIEEGDDPVCIEEWYGKKYEGPKH